MSTSSNFTVINGGGWVGIVPVPDVAFSAEGLLGIIERIRTELEFKGDVSAGTEMFYYWNTPRFGIRLNGASAAMADRLRSLDLFPPQPAEDLDRFEVRFVYKNLAYIDPRLVLTIATMIEFASALGTRFRTKANFWLHGTQFVFDACMNLTDVDAEMIAFCQPLYRHLSKVVGRHKDGHVWIELEGPAHLFELSDILRQEYVLLDPEPVYTRNRSSLWPTKVAIAVTAKVVTAADIKHLYEIAIRIAMGLGLHPLPLDDFRFIHEEGLTTALRTSTLSNR